MGGKRLITPKLQTFLAVVSQRLPIHINPMKLVNHASGSSLDNVDRFLRLAAAANTGGEWGIVGGAELTERKSSIEPSDVVGTDAKVTGVGLADGNEENVER
jgi:hypothetical protein